MRNLKRALSLTLASVMLLGMMIVGTSAASFKDADDISNVTAATVLQDLNIMVGDGENFMPDQIVTRGQMAIIICKILYGDKLNVSQFAGTTQYTDVKVDDYFNGYVNLATSLGIISGYGNGQFGPGDPVTTAQAALMLCKALGYFQAKELVGDWATDAMTAITKATQLKLFGSLNLATNEGLSRDNVAEMTFNTITKVTPVQYNELWNMYYTDSESIMSGVKFFYDETLGYRNYKLVYTDGEDAFGNPTTVWGTSDKTLKLKADGSIDTKSFNNIPQTNQITSAANKPLASYTAKVTLGTLYDLVGKSTVDDLKDAGETAAKLTVVKDGETIVNGSKTAADVDSYFVKYSSDKVGGAGTLTKVYLDSDGAVTITMEQTYVFQASGDYNSRKESVRVVTAGDTEIVLTSSELSSDDFVNVKDVKDSDYLLITAVKQSGGKYDVKSVRPAQVVTGSVETYTVEDSVTIDGTKYGYSATAQKGDGHVVSTSYTVGQDASLVLDAYDNVIAIAEALNSSNYVYIKEAAQASGLAGGTVSADAFFTDGTNEVVNVVKAYIYIDSAATTNKAEIKNGIGGKWFTYSVNGSGEYTLYSIEKKYTQATGYYKDNASDNLDTVVTANGVVNFSTTTGSTLSGNMVDGTVGGTPVTLKANDNTILIVENNDNTSTAYVGVKNLPDITLNEDLAKVVKMDYVNNDKGFTTYAFIDMSAISTTEGSVVDGAEAAEFVYVLDYKSQTYIKDMGTFFTYKALVDGSTEPEDKMFDAKLLSGDDEYALYYKARENKDGYVTTLPEVPATGKYFNKALDNQAITYSSGALNIGGTAYTLANDAEITLITLKGTNLNKDPGAKYEIASVTPKGLGDTLAKVMVTGNYAGELTEAGKTVIKTLYVTVAKTTAKLDSDVTADEIEDALNTEGAATTPENAKIDKAVEVKKDQTLTLSETNKLNGDVTAKSGASVVIAGDVSGTGSVKAESGATVVIQNGSSAKVEAAAGSTVVIEDAIPTLADRSSLAGTVKVGSVAVVGEQELPAGAEGTVIEGTVSIPANGVLTLSGEVTLGEEGAIMAAEGATIVVADEADVDALLGLEGVKFYDADGNEITENLPAGTYVWSDDWNAKVRTAETKPGWMLQDEGGDETVAKKSEVVKAVMSESDYNAVMPQFFGSGKKFPGYGAVATVTEVADGKLVVSSNGQGGLPYVTNFTAFNEAVTTEQSGYYVMVTFTVTKPENVSSIADDDVIVTLGDGKTLKKNELGADSWDIAVMIHISADNVKDSKYTGGAMTYTIDADGSGTEYEATEYTLDFAGVTFKAQDDGPVNVDQIS